MTELATQTLADCLEDIQSGKLTASECIERYPEQAGELAPLMRVANRLLEAGNIEPRTQFVETAHARLVKQLQTRRPGFRLPKNAPGVSNTAPAHRKFYYQAWFIAAIFLLLVVSLGTGTVYASSQALPGDWLYPVKLDVEEARYTLTAQQNRVDLLVKFSEVRRAEISALEKAGRYSDMSVAVSKLESISTKLVDKFGEQYQESNQAVGENETKVNTSLENNAEVLNRVLEIVPPQAQPAIQHALEMSQKNNFQFHEILSGKYKNKERNNQTLNTQAPNGNDTSQGKNPKPAPENTHKPDNPGNKGNNPGNIPNNNHP